jgi:hypothetical protein
LEEDDDAKSVGLHKLSVLEAVLKSHRKTHILSGGLGTTTSKLDSGTVYFRTLFERDGMG